MRSRIGEMTLRERKKRLWGDSLASLILGCILVVSSVAGPVHAAGSSADSDIELNQSLRQAIIERIVTTFDEYYIDPEIAHELGRKLKARAQDGDYREFDSLDEFTSRLTQDLCDWADDLHIKVMPYEELPAYRFENRLVGDPQENFGFEKVEVLTGNVGYLELSGFYSTREAGPTAVAAMNFLGHCRALIIDLRLNGGGDESMATLLSSYLLGESTHLSSDYFRLDDKTIQDWSYEWVPGPRLVDVPVYILLSRLSFSCSELFSFALQQLHRAVIIGEQTRGGGHSVTYLSFPAEHINLRIPYSRTFNPVNGAGFQSVGVTPDIEARPWDALAVANIEIAKSVLDTTRDEAERARFEWIRQEYAAAIAPPDISDSGLRQYVGTYGEETVDLECGKLVYRDPRRPARDLIFLGGDLFTLRSDRDYSRYRIQFVRNDAGVVAGLHFVDDDGDVYDTSWRSSE